MDQRNTTRSIIIIMIGVIVAGSSLTAIHTLSADTTNQRHINGDNNSYHEDNSNSNSNISPARQQQWVIQNVGISPSNEDSAGREDVGVSGDGSGNVGVIGEFDEFAMKQSDNYKNNNSKQYQLVQHVDKS